MSIHTIYAAGVSAALTKLGMNLEFDTPEQQQLHERRRRMAGTITGTAGSVLGGIGGGIVGTAAGGPVGSLAGAAAGSVLGEKLMSAPVTTAMDAYYDARHRGAKQYNQTMGRLQRAAGLPTGGHNV